MSVLAQMLLGFQHSPEPFHKVGIKDAVDLKTTLLLNKSTLDFSTRTNQLPYEVVYSLTTFQKL